MPAPAFKVVDATPIPATGAAALVPPAPVIAEPTPDHPMPRPVDVETLLAAAPFARDTVTSSVPPSPLALAIAEAGDDEWEWTATRLGGLLMALGSSLSSAPC